MFTFALIKGLNLSSHVFVDYLALLCLELLELIFGHLLTGVKKSSVIRFKETLKTNEMFYKHTLKEHKR